MRLLAIIGSPRKGNTYEVVRQVELSLRNRGDVDLEYVFLDKADIRTCRGCYLCMSKGEKFCPLKDGCASVVEKMQKADGLIIASPVYTGNVSGTMKNFMDRLAYFSHRPGFLGKPAMLVATSAGPEFDGTLKALSWFAYTGFEIVVNLGQVTFPTKRKVFSPAVQGSRQIERAAESFAKALSRGAPTPHLWRIFQFYSMKAFFLLDPDYFSADCAYYLGREDYHNEFPIPRWKRLLGKLYYWGARKWIALKFVSRPPS